MNKKILKFFALLLLMIATIQTQAQKSISKEDIQSKKFRN
jgi:hypothetical protein